MDNQRYFTTGYVLFSFIFNCLQAVADTCGGVTHPNISVNPTDYGLVPSQYSAVCQITSQGIGNGFIEDNLSLTDNVLWVLNGPVNVGLSIAGGAQNPITDPNSTDAAVLTIETGTTIIGDYDSTDSLQELDFLIISRGSRIIASGEAENPIRFTSRQAVTGEIESEGQWGGIVLNGYARINHCSSGNSELDCESTASLGAGQYGGNDDTDNSGELRYVRIENAGSQLSAGLGFDGLSLNGVGSTTVIESIQVHNSSGNGIHVSGGAVKLGKTILTNNLGTALTWGNGWGGVAEQLLVTIPATGGAALDGFNHQTNTSAIPQSNPVIVNSTIISESADTVIQLREGTAAQFYTQVIYSPSGACYLHDAVDVNGLIISHSRIACNSIGVSQLESDWYSSGEFNNSTLTVDLNGYINGSFLSGAITFGLPIIDNVSHAGYIGAVGFCSDDWTQGWSIALPAIDTELCIDPSLQVPVSHSVGWFLLPLFAVIASKR